MTATEKVLFYNGGGTMTVQYDGSEDLVVKGLLGFHFGSVAPGKLTLDLNGKKWVFDGGTLRFDINRGDASAREALVMTNGTVQFGAGSSMGDFLVGGGDAISGTATPNNQFAFTYTFSGSTVFDSRNLRYLGVVDDGLANSDRNFVLDLTATNFVSGEEGERAGVLTVQESMVIANSAVTGPAAAGRKKVGVLKMGAASEINIGTDLIIGQYIRPTTGTNNIATVDGTLEMLSTHSETTLNIGRDLRVGVGDSATGQFKSTPEILNVAIGNAEDDVSDRGVLYVGYKNSSQYMNDGDTSGSFVGGTEGGEVTAYVKELRVGQNTRAAGSAEGVLDLRNSSTILLDVAGDAVIGSGVNGVGEVYLSRGSASSETLSVGNATGTTDRSLLSLGETNWSVTEMLAIGALGEIYVTVTDGGGIDLLSGDAGAFSVATDGFLEATFDEAVGGDPLWALRWVGKHDTLLASYLDTGLLRGGGAFGGDATVFYDGEYTYFGLAQAIPEPSTLVLLGVFGGLGLFAARQRRRN